MDNSAGEGLPSLYDHTLRAMMVEVWDGAVIDGASFGAGAERPPGATEGMQEALIVCWLVQFPEQEPCAGEADVPEAAASRDAARSWEAPA